MLSPLIPSLFYLLSVGVTIILSKIIFKSLSIFELIFPLKAKKITLVFATFVLIIIVFINLSNLSPLTWAIISDKESNKKLLHPLYAKSDKDMFIPPKSAGEAT